MKWWHQWNLESCQRFRFAEVSRCTSDILHNEGFDVEWENLTGNCVKYVCMTGWCNIRRQVHDSQEEGSCSKSLGKLKTLKNYASRCQFFACQALEHRTESIDLQDPCDWHQIAREWKPGLEAEVIEEHELKASTSNCWRLFVKDLRIENLQMSTPYRPYWIQDVQILSRGELCGGDGEAKAVDEFGGFATSMLQAVHKTEMLWNEEIREIKVPSCLVNDNMTTCNGTVSVSRPLKVVQDDANPDAPMCKDLNQSLISMDSPCNWQHSAVIKAESTWNSQLFHSSNARGTEALRIWKDHISVQSLDTERVEFGPSVHPVGAQADRLTVFTQRPQKGSSWDAASASRTSQSKRILCGSCVVHPFVISSTWPKKTFVLIHHSNSDIN